jgi:hypothetical protein
MKSLKFAGLALVLIFVSSSMVFAGAPAPTTEKPVPVEEVTAPPPPPAPVKETVQPLVISRHLTLGLGIGGNPLIGFSEKDNYGYVYTEAGLCTGIGIAMTWFKGQPTAADVYAAEKKVRADNPSALEKDIPSLVRQELGVNTLSYVGLGILNAEMGQEWILSDNSRFRLGIGLPTIISFGINWDF